VSSIKLRCLFFATLSLVANVACAADVSWLGGSSNVTLGTNWSNGSGPGVGDRAMIGGAPNAPDLSGNTVNWGRLYMNVSNNVADTGGGGVINLSGANHQMFTEGAENSTIAPAVVATGLIQTNGQHNVTFNGDVTAQKLEAFGGSVITLNGVTTQTDEFMSIGGGSKIVINGDFHWNNPNHGINNGPVIELGPNAKFFRTGNVPGLDVFNLFNSAVVRLLADNALGTSGETDLWDRHGNSTFDLNGFDQFVEFLATAGDQIANPMKLDFGATSGANSLVWDASHNMDGTYSVLNFEQGLDTLEFGQHGNNGGFIPVNLLKITVNGAPYLQSAPGDGSAWWNAIATPNQTDDPGRQIAVYHAAVPEPASMMLLSIALIGAGSLGRSRIRR